MPGIHTSVLPKKLSPGGGHERSEIKVSQIVIDSSRLDVSQLLEKFETSHEGLPEEEALRRLVKDGPNVLAKDQRAGIVQLVLHAVMNPLVILLAVLACISVATGDFRAGTVMTLMIVLGVGLKLILLHTESHVHARIPDYAKVDEIPFDFQRRIMSVVVRTPEGQDRIISKGAPEAIFPKCDAFELDGELFPMDHLILRDLEEEFEQLSRDGFRVLAIAFKDVAPRPEAEQHSTPYSKADEAELILKG